MSVSILKLVLIFATLHLHAPLCLLFADNRKAEVADNSSLAVDNECPCCKTCQTKQRKNTPETPDRPIESKPVQCLCAISATGYVSLTPAAQTTVLGDVPSTGVSIQLPVATCDGYQEGIQRPPRS